MSDIVVAGFLISGSVFLIGVVFLPGNVLSISAAWPAGRLAQSSLGEAARTAKWLGTQDDQVGKAMSLNLAPLQVAAGALGLLGGLVLSMAFPFPLGAWFIPMIFGIASYQVPAALVKQKLAAQRRAALRELPEVVSLLQAFPQRNLMTALASITRARHGPLAAAIKEALERSATGVPLLKALEEATASLQIEEAGRFVEVLSQAQATSTRSGELLRAYEQELLSRRREAALRLVETAEGKISAVLTVATAMQLLLLLVVPSLLQFLAPGPA